MPPSVPTPGRAAFGRILPEPSPRRLIEQPTPELLRACRANDRTAQRRLYRAALPHLHLVCRRYLRYPADLKDALQESFLAVFRGLDGYDANRGPFGAWARRVTINVCLRQNERYARRATDELVVNLHEPAIPPAAYANFSAEELIAWLRRMPAPYFAVFNAHVIDGFSHREVAELLGIEETLSRQRLSRARAWLRKHLPAEYEAPGGWSGRLKSSALPLLVWTFAHSLTPLTSHCHDIC